MTQEGKELLLKDLSARLPYNTMLNVNDGKYRKDVKLHPHYIFDWDAERWDAKPYLRPMSSMTDEEKEHLQSLHNIISDENYGDGYSPAAWETISEFNDYCNAHHLDNRGLIGKGLALEAPEHMYD